MNKYVIFIFLILIITGCNNSFEKEFTSLNNTAWKNKNTSFYIGETFTIINHGSQSGIGMPFATDTFVYKRIGISDSCFVEQKVNYYCFIGKVKLPNGSFHNHFDPNKTTYGYILVDEYGSTLLYYQFLSQNEIIVGVTYGTGIVLWMSRIQND